MPARERLKQVDICELEAPPGLHSELWAGQGYTIRPSLKKTKATTITKNRSVKKLDGGLERWLGG